MTIALHVERRGVGPPIVLTHGLGDSSATWGAMVPLLTGDHEIITWDLRGHGFSDAPSGADDYSRDIAVADLCSVLELVETPVTLVGHSLGGYLSLLVTLRHPALVRALVMIASGPGFGAPSAREEWNAFVDRAASRMPIPPPAAGLCHQPDGWVIGNLVTISRPLLQIIGERDVRFHAGVDHIARLVPTSTTARIPGAGHHPQQTHSDCVAALVARHAVIA